MIKPPSAKSHEKIGLVVFSIFALATFILGYAQIKKSIYLPFVRKPNTYKTTEELDKEREDQLKNIDTDKDGLTDYDELYVFHTSPFLEDSDSDGVPDGKEVADGADPNCPKGKVCRQASLGNSGSGSGAASPLTPTTVSPTDQGGSAAPAPTSQEQQMKAIIDTFGDPSALTKEKITMKVDAMSSVDLRTFLITMGVPQNALDKSDDTTLRKLLEDTLVELAAANQGASAPPTEPAP